MSCVCGWLNRQMYLLLLLLLKVSEVVEKEDRSVAMINRAEQHCLGHLCQTFIIIIIFNFYVP